MTVQLTTRVDKATKLQFDKVCESIGVSPSNAINIFVKGVINYNGIPFKIIASPPPFTYTHHDGKILETAEDEDVFANQRGNKLWTNKAL